MAFTYPQPTREQEDDFLKDFNYSRQQLESDKVLLRTWLNEQEHFPESRKRENDAFLVSYLVGCKGSMEKAKRKLDFYYSIRGHGDLFTERDTLECVESADTFQYFSAMPKLTPEGRIVTMVGLRTADVNKWILKDGFKKTFLYHEWRLRQGTGIIKGDIYLMDAKGFSAAHTMQLSLSVLKTVITWLTEACPIRLFKVVVINAEPLFDRIANTLIRPLLSKKLKQRFIVTSDGDVSKYLDCMDILPTTYGGKEIDMVTLSREFSIALKAGVKDILPTLGETTDESKRPKLHGYTDNPHLGAFGSIKTLVTD